MKYRPTSFDLRELVPPDVHKTLGERAWDLLDAYALHTLQTLRDKLGPIIVNTWHNGGTFSESGLRSFATSTGAKFSQHKYGRAFDCKFIDVTPREALDYVQKHTVDFPYLTTVENPDATPTWFHFDTRNCSHSGIWIVNP